MTTPAEYPSALVAELWGGVAGSPAGVDFTAACSAAQSGAEGREGRRRQLAGTAPGYGAQVPIAQPVAGPGVGLSDVDLPVIGEGYAVTAPDAPQRKSFGPLRPSYADPVVSGAEYPAAAAVGPVLRRHVTDLGPDGLLIGPRADGSNDALHVISPQPAPRRSLLGRVFGRLRRK